MIKYDVLAMLCGLVSAFLIIALIAFLVFASNYMHDPFFNSIRKVSKWLKYMNDKIGGVWSAKNSRREDV